MATKAIRRPKKGTRRPKPEQRPDPRPEPGVQEPPDVRAARALRRTADRLLYRQRKSQSDAGEERRRVRELRLRAARRKFVHFYVHGGDDFEPGNGARSAVAAGLSSTLGAGSVRAHMLLRRPEVLEAVERDLEAARLSDERLVAELGRIAMSSVRDVDAALRALEAGTVQDLPDHVAAVIGSIKKRVHYDEEGNPVTEYEVRRDDKLAALLGLAKIKRLLVSRHELTGKNGGPIELREQVVVYVPDNGRGALPAPAAAALPPAGEVVDAEVVPERETVAREI